MKSFQTDLKQYTEKVRLKAAERRELRERVLAYMEYHPLPKKREQIIVQPVGSIVSEPFTTFRINALYMRIASGIALTFLFVVIPTIAERSLPGDVLYLVKTEVNETIRGNFAETPYEKVEYETKLIQRRIAEARLLASEGKLTDEVQAQIVKTVKSHASAAQSGIAKMRETNVDDAAIAQIAFGSALAVQSAMLDVEQTETAKSSTSGIRDAVNTVRGEVAADQNTTAPSYEGLSAGVERETTRAYELFTVVKVSATPDEIANIERRLQDSDRKILNARAIQERGEDGAVLELTEALGVLQKLIVFMADISVRKTVTLESLVPVVLTLEERVAAVETLLQELNVTLLRVEERTLLLTDEGVREKVEDGVLQARTLIDAATSSLAADPIDIENAELVAKEAHAFVLDLDMLTGGGVEVEFLVPTEETPATGTSTATETSDGTGIESDANELATTTTETEIGGVPLQ
jgi:hypothetical protein